MSVSYDQEQEPIVLSKALIDKLLKSDNFAELLALYTFYYYTAKWQKTNQPYATTKYVAKGLKWGEDKVRKYKKQLKSLGLVEDVQLKNECNRFEKSYIKVNFIWSKSIIEERFSRTMDFPESGVDRSAVESGINALSTVSGNALSANKEILFAKAWNTYNKKRNKEKCRRKFLNLPLKTIDLIMKHVPEYVRSTPDKQYRKDFFTYLNNNSWKDEIIIGEPNGSNKAKTQGHQNRGLNIKSARGQPIQYTGA